jgi:hypothetical protein
VQQVSAGINSTNRGGNQHLNSASASQQGRAGEPHNAKAGRLHRGMQLAATTRQMRGTTSAVTQLVLEGQLDQLRHTVLPHCAAL